MSPSLKQNKHSKWGKQKELIVSTFKAITHPILEYVDTIWSPITSNTNIKTLQTIQNTVMCIAIVCTPDTNTQYLHDKNKVLLMDTQTSCYSTKTTDSNTNTLYMNLIHTLS